MASLVKMNEGWYEPNLGPVTELPKSFYITIENIGKELDKDIEVKRLKGIIDLD